MESAVLLFLYASVTISLWSLTGVFIQRGVNGLHKVTLAYLVFAGATVIALDIGSIMLLWQRGL